MLCHGLGGWIIPLSNCLGLVRQNPVLRNNVHQVDNLSGKLVFFWLSPHESVKYLSNFGVLIC